MMAKTMKKKKISKKRGGNKTFYLYTTGIGDWGNRHYSLANIWNEFLLPQSINILAFSGYTNIIINHHDTEGVGGNEGNYNGWARINKEEYRQNIEKILNYDRMINGIVNVQSRYYNTPIDFDHIDINSHLIFDFAHIFNYMYLPGSPKSLPITREKDKIYPNINSIYFDYLGQNEGETNRAINRRRNITSNGNKAVSLMNLITSVFFKVNEDNTVQTYIDMISYKSLLHDIIRLPRMLTRNHNRTISSLNLKIGLNNNNVENIIINYPGDVIRMICEKIYLDRFGELKNNGITRIKPRDMSVEDYIENVNQFFSYNFMPEIMQ